MSGRNLITNPGRQSGAFLVEFALIAPVIALVLVFVTDMVGKQTIKGRLHGLAYSAVSVIKERVELYAESTADGVNDRVKVTESQADMVYDIVKNSLGRTMAGFDEKRMGYFLEQQKFYEQDNQLKPFPATGFNGGGIDCQPERRLKDMTGLHIKTGWDRPVSLYQVTLCYKDNNSFGDLVDKDYSLVKANAIMLGR